MGVNQRVQAQRVWVRLSLRRSFALIAAEHVEQGLWLETVLVPSVR